MQAVLPLKVSLEVEESALDKVNPVNNTGFLSGFLRTKRLMPGDKKNTFCFLH